jgi:hypothetical protein
VAGAQRVIYPRQQLISLLFFPVLHRGILLVLTGMSDKPLWGYPSLSDVKYSRMPLPLKFPHGHNLSHWQYKQRQA